MTKLAEYIQVTRELVREANGAIQHDMGDTVYEGFIRRALRRYSIDKPLEKVSSVTGTGSQYVTVDATNFPNYVDGFSTILKVEAKAPTIADNQKPNFLDRDLWELYRDNSALRFFFNSNKPSSSDTIRFTYTILHTIDELDSETTDSVPEMDKEAIILWGAGEAFGALAGKYAGTSDPTLRADVVNYRTRSSEFQRLAKEKKEQYKSWISDPIKAASTIRDLNFGFGFADDQPFLNHRSFSRR